MRSQTNTDQTLVLPIEKPDQPEDLYSYSKNATLPIGSKIMNQRNGNIKGY